MEKLIKRKTKIIIKFPFCIVQESLNPKCQKRFQVPVKIKYNVYRSNTLKYAYHIIIASVQLRLARGAGYISSNIILCKRNPGRYDIIIKLLFLFKYTTSVCTPLSILDFFTRPPYKTSSAVRRNVQIRFII